METILHEKQEGSLCAQHCLNALLQGSYFSAVDLAEIARQLDDTEKARMAEAGVHTTEYNAFINQESTNFDDSGFFSIQVLQQALRVWDLDLVPYNSSDEQARAARQDPRSQQAYICNFREHWFTIRKLGQQWFNLNSMFKRPEIVSDTYLHMLLMQLQTEGYSIFIVRGALPACEADQLLQLVRVEAPPSAGKSATDTDADPEVQRALQASRQLSEQAEGSLQQALRDSAPPADQDDDLQRALALSLEAGGGGGSATTSATGPSTSSTSAATSAATAAELSTEELRRRRLAYLTKQTLQPEEGKEKNT